MPKRYQIELSQKEEDRLKGWTRNPPKAYLRYRAQAILQVAEGQPIYQVAQNLRIRIHRNAVSEWVKRYEAEGIKGLKVKAGRGRKPAFFPPKPKGG